MLMVNKTSNTTYIILTICHEDKCNVVIIIWKTHSCKMSQNKTIKLSQKNPPKTSCGESMSSWLCKEVFANAYIQMAVLLCKLLLKGLHHDWLMFRTLIFADVQENSFFFKLFFGLLDWIELFNHLIKVRECSLHAK